MNLVIEAPAAKAIRKMPPHDRAALLEKLKAFAADPFASHGWAKTLVGSPLIRVRHGDWRAVCRIDRDVTAVAVVKAGHRKEVYE